VDRRDSAEAFERPDGRLSGRMNQSSGEKRGFENLRYVLTENLTLRDLRGVIAWSHAKTALFGTSPGRSVCSLRGAASYFSIIGTASAEAIPLAFRSALLHGRRHLPRIVDRLPH
jgi:hypothetical protein